jgi:hypothetical protein
MSRGKLSFQPTGAVSQEFFDGIEWCQILRGPLAAGKTYLCAAKVFWLMCNQRPTQEGVRKSRWLCMRNTDADLRNTTIRDFRAVIPEGAGRLTMGAPPEYKLDFYLPDGTHVVAEVIFVACDRPDDVRKLRGMNLTGVWFNEMKELEKPIVDMALGRTDRYPVQGYSNWAGGFGDTNAWDHNHWLQDLWKEKVAGRLPNFGFYTMPGAVLKVDGKWVVNPLRENRRSPERPMLLGDEYYEKQIEGKREDWIRVNLANEIGFSFGGKAVHPDYQESIHVAKDLLRPVPGIVYVGMDFGLSPAAGFFQRQANGQQWGLEEVVCQDMGAVRFADALKAKTAQMKALTAGLTFVFRGDPSGDQRVGTDEQTVFQALRANGISALPCSTNDPQLRRDALDRPLTRMVDGKPGLLVSPSMIVFREGMAGGFCYKRVLVAGSEKYRDVPDKNKYSHVVEAAEYALLDSGEHAIVNAAQAQHFPKNPVAARGDWDPRKL